MGQHNNKKNKKNVSKKSWPVILFVGGGILLLIGAFFAFVKPSQINAALDGTGTPRLEVDQELVNFGDVEVNRLVEATFRLTNTGDGTLRFSSDPYVEVLEGC